MLPNSILPGLLSGTMLALSLPKPDFYPLAWIALAPLLYVLARETDPWRVMAAGYAAGFVFFAGTFYWFADTMMIYGGLPFLLAGGVAALFSAAFALYFVVFALGLHFLIRRFGSRAMLFAAPVWVTVELMRAHLFSGFPWMLSGYALVPYPGILQIVTWTGVFGLSFIAAAVNAAVAYGVWRRRWIWLAPAGAVIAAAWLMPVAGETPSDQPAGVRLVQTNIPIEYLWNEASTEELLGELAELSTMPPSSRLSGDLQLIVWPETPSPFYLGNDPHFTQRVRNIALKPGAYFLLGYIGYEGEKPFNSAGLLSPAGDLVSRYDKMHLVPFGEYVPYRRLLFFAESMTRQVGDFTPGTEHVVSSMGNRLISTAICYESIFPNLVRQFVKQGSELIVVITNDGWFGETSAPFQHLRMGVVRAVENRRYVIRAANTGISAIIDPYGRIQAQTAIGVRTALDGTAHFRTERTFYTQYGDVFAYLNAISVACGVLIAMLVRSGKKEAKTGTGRVPAEGK